MAMTLTGFVYDNAGNAIADATVQGYVSADNATTTAESSTATDSNGKWSITTSTAARIPMDVKITYGSNVRWIKAGDKVNVTDMTVTGTLTVGEDAAGFDFSLFSSDTSGDGLTWDASEEVLQITGKDANTALDVLDGDVRIVDKLYFYDRGGEYLSSDGSTLTITGATTISGGLTSTAASNTLGATSFNEADITNVGAIALDSITPDLNDINIAISDNRATALTVKQGSDAYLIIDTADSSESVSIGTGISGTEITLGHSTSEVYVADNLTVTGDLTVSGTQTIVDTVTMNAANAVVFEGATADNYETTLTIEDPTADRTVVIPNVGGTLAVLAADSDTAITATPAELNLLDGGTSVGGSITIADTDGFVVNDGGTMKTIPASDINTYVGDSDTTYSAGDGLDLSGTTFSTDLKSNGGLEIQSTELSVAQGISQYDVAQFAASVADNDFLRIDGTAVEGLSASEVAAAIEGSIDAVGALDSGSITSNFGNINTGSSTITTTGAVATGALTAGGIIKTDDSTNATSTTDGSLQTDGGLSVVLDAVFGDDVTLITDSAVLNLGVGSDVKLTHDGTTGGTLSGTPMVVEGLGAASLANDTHAGVVLEFLAAESIAVGQLVYMSTTDARVGLADANDSGKYPAIGVAVSAQGSAGSAVKILTHGTFNDSDGFGGDLTEGNVLYLSETAGGFTATAPSDDGDRVQVVGVAIGPRDVFINPSLDVIEHD